MKLRFKQRLFSWFDSYDIYREDGTVLFTVEGKFSWGHCLHILDANGVHIGTVQEKVMTILPQFELYAYGDYLGCIRQEFNLFTPQFTIDCSDWTVAGNFMGWDYTITSPTQGIVAIISKEILQWTDTYSIDVPDAANTLCSLMVVLSIDAGKCRG